MEAVAIDGPAASGKSTVGRDVAERLGFGFLDTGSMYRAAALWAIRRGVDVSDEAGLTALAESVRMDLDGDRLRVDGVDVTDGLRMPNVERNVSAVSAVAGVRRALVPQQRRIAEDMPIVMVGRDIGTVVLADARVKVYLDATVEIRARRRYAEIMGAGMDVDPGHVLWEIARRDRVDAGRADSPLAVAEDAVVIHTNDLDAGEVASRIVDLVEGRQ